jgi:preprotein translocase subunit SecB
MTEATNTPTPSFNIEKIYVKDLSLEVPNAPAVYLEREQPQMDVQLTSQGGKVAEDLFEVSIRVTVTARVQDKTLFLVEAAQCGLFRIAGVPDDQLGMVIGIGCPNILFPYLRETISDAVGRAGFPPLMLNPVNFEALYMQQAQQNQTANGAQASH